MATGTIFTKFTPKFTPSSADLYDRWLKYLDKRIVESTGVRYDLDGVFGNKLVLGSSTNDTFSVSGTEKSTDGLGRIFQVSALDSSEFRFENESGANYDVGFQYASIPVAVTLNTKLAGKPEYTQYKDYLGNEGTPDLIIDSGSGVLQFTVDSICESGVDFSGRTVLVYKKEPDPNALTEAIAFAKGIVGFNGTSNFVQVGYFGQTTPSTDIQDYTVVLLGATVKRNSSLQNVPGVFFVGAVTGSGAGTTPSVFDTTNQRTLQSVNDASGIGYSTNDWILGPTVQTALDSIVSNLGSVGSTPGSSQVGFSTSNLRNKNTGNVSNGLSFGLGNSSDSTFTSSPDIQQLVDTLQRKFDEDRTWVTASTDPLSSDANLRANLDVSGGLQSIDNPGASKIALRDNTEINGLVMLGASIHGAQPPGQGETKPVLTVRKQASTVAGSVLSGTVLKEITLSESSVDVSDLTNNPPSPRITNRLLLVNSYLQGVDISGVNIDFQGPNLISQAQISCSDLDNFGPLFSFGGGADVLFHKCNFSIESNNSDIFGNVSRSGQRVVFHNCTFSTASGDASNFGRLIGWIGVEIEIIFDNCRFQSSGITGSFDSSSVTESVFNFLQFSDDVITKFHNCTFNLLSGIPLKINNSPGSSIDVYVAENSVNWDTSGAPLRFSDMERVNVEILRTVSSGSLLSLVECRSVRVVHNFETTSDQFASVSSCGNCHFELGERTLNNSKAFFLRGENGNISIFANAKLGDDKSSEFVDLSNKFQANSLTVTLTSDAEAGRKARSIVSIGDNVHISNLSIFTDYFNGFPNINQSPCRNVVSFDGDNSTVESLKICRANNTGGLGLICQRAVNIAGSKNVIKSLTCKFCSSTTGMIVLDNSSWSDNAVSSIYIESLNDLPVISDLGTRTFISDIFSSGNWADADVVYAMVGVNGLLFNSVIFNPVSIFNNGINLGTFGSESVNHKLKVV